jgi:serine/threonine protein kinase
VDELRAALRASRLLSTQQVDSLPDVPASSPLDGRSWADGLVAEGVLTSFQVEQLLAGQGASLVLGPYRILDRLGAGGMGQVYKAEHILMKRLVALKVIAPSLVRDEAALACFQSEIQVAAQMSHPNLIAAYDAAEANGLHFLVMEYMDGIDLRRLVETSGPLSVRLACECIRQAALGLQHAHEHGLVHCDIKPSNLLLGYAGNPPSPLLGERGRVTPNPSPPRGRGAFGSELPLVKLLDFGLARLVGSPPTAATAATWSELQTTLAGTPHYLAPEQAYDCQRADIRSDLYSLGCTFFYLLTAQVPYPGDTWSETLLRHQFDPTPSVTKHRPEVPEEIAAVVGHLMAKDPDERFQSPGELAAVLLSWLAGPIQIRHDPDRFTVASWGAFQRRIAWSIAVCAAVLVGLGLAWLARPDPASDSNQSQLLPSTTSNFITLQSMPGAAFTRLEEAIGAAANGDTIVLEGDGPFASRSISLKGKSLTLKAAAGCRPRIEHVPSKHDAIWEPLFTADRPLVLEGLELCRKGTNGSQTAHLVYSDDAAVRLVDCRLLAPGGRAVLVFRNARTIEIQNCLVAAGASAICLEEGDAGLFEIKLVDSRVVVNDPGGAALTLWQRDSSNGPARINLRNNTIEAGRIISVAGLQQRLELNAERNTFHFHEAVLSCLEHEPEALARGPANCSLTLRACSQAPGAARLLQWKGQANRFRGSGEWLMINGAAAGLPGLSAWREYWNDAEAESLEERPADPLKPTPLEPSSQFSYSPPSR